MKKSDDKEAERAKLVVQIAKDYAPCPHLFVWALAGNRYPGIHPAEVYRAVKSDPELSFDGRTSIISIRNNTKEA